MAKAKNENKLVLLDFTGSDWCGWCIRMDEEALGKPEFIDYAAKYLVTVVVDFPRTHELAADAKRANKVLYNKYGVEGFPTLVALSPDGKVVWKQTGYIAGGPFAVIAPLNRSRLAMGWPEPAGTTVSNVAAVTPQPAPGKLATSTSPPSPPAPAPPPTPHGLPASAPKLQGIVYSTKNASVILDGKQCEEGESVRGMKVLRIFRDHVAVEWEGRTNELTMN